MRKNGFANIILIIVLAILAIGVGTYIIVTKQIISIPGANQPQTNNADTHGCTVSAGYVWCAYKNKCLIPADESCEDTTTVPAGWPVYENIKYSYAISHPTEATIVTAAKNTFILTKDNMDKGLTIDKIYNQYGSELCVQVKLLAGYIYISAPPNKNFSFTQCGRTGVGYETEAKTENLIIEGQNYTAAGYREKGPGNKLPFISETMTVTLTDGTRIEYGSVPGATGDLKIYNAMRPTLLKIIQSYHQITAETAKPENKLTQTQAFDIAKKSVCLNQGTLTSKFIYNESTRTWWIDLTPTTPKQGCSPACVVNELTGAADINWRCTGLILPKK